MVEFLQNYGNEVVTVLLVFVVYLLGVRAFYREKEYELVRDRYLFKGIDLFAGDIEHALQVNAALLEKALHLLRQYRELAYGLPKALLDEPVPNIEMGRFRAITSSRVHSVSGTNAFWEGIQMLFAQCPGI